MHGGRGSLVHSFVPIREGAAKGLLRVLLCSQLLLPSQLLPQGQYLCPLQRDLWAGEGEKKQVGRLGLPAARASGLQALPRLLHKLSGQLRPMWRII